MSFFLIAAREYSQSFCAAVNIFLSVEQMMITSLDD